MIINIGKLKKGDKITPKTIDMENETSTYYRFIKFIEGVEKIGDEWIKTA